MKWIRDVVALSLVIAAGTWLAGWWVVPIVGAAYGAWAAQQRSAVLSALLASAAGWGLLLAYDATVGPVGRLTQLFGTLFRLPSGTLILVTLAYAALLGGAAASLARGIRRLSAPA